jgi:DNA-binding GntR family transcriptional regulator
VIEPIKRLTVTEATTRKLREMILSGVVPAGTPLRQEEFSEYIGVSRTPLREALTRLDSEGFVVQDPHMGAVVYRPTAKDLMECLEIQRALEPMAARLAAANRTDDEVEQFKALLAGFHRQKTPRTWADHNEKFHLFLCSLARRRHLLELIGRQQARSKMYVRMFIGEERAPHAGKEHEAIVVALEKRDPRIETLLQRHIDGTIKVVARLMKSKND